MKTKSTYNAEDIYEVLDNMTKEDLTHDLAIYNEEHGTNEDIEDPDFLNWVCQTIENNFKLEGHTLEV